MTDTIEIFSIISFIVGVILFIAFLTLTSNVGKIRRILESYGYCKHCQYESKSGHDFCPICGKNDSGKTLEQVKSEYLRNGHCVK